MGARSTNPTQSFFDDFFRSGTDAMSDAPTGPSPITATGGQSTLDISGYKVHLFTNTGPQTFNVQSGNGEVEYLVVAGGGSGSAQYGGGGGAGGLRTNLSGHPRAGNPFTVTPGPYPVVVGAGGQYATPPSRPGVAGGNSSFGPIVATGGGGGGAPGQDANPWGSSTNGGPGGSGGGGAGRTGSNAPNYDGGAGNAGGFPAPTREGYDGGDGWFDGNRAGGGGGGAGGAGTNGGPNAGPGGVGIQVLIAGNPSPIGTPGPGGTTGWFAGGGGGGGYNVNAGSGGAGGGGGGAYPIPPTGGIPGTANTGGGGGGGFHPGATTGGNGGSGIVAIRYAV